jgi:hypothetical protein
MSDDLNPAFNPHPVCNIICVLNEKCAAAASREDFEEAHRIADITRKLKAAVVVAWNEVGQTIEREAGKAGG